MNTTSPTAAIPYDSDEVSDHKQALLDQIRDSLRTDLNTDLTVYGHALATVRCAPEGLAVIRDECGDVLRAVADEYVGQGWAVNEGMVDDLRLEAACVDPPGLARLSTSRKEHRHE